MLYTVFETVGFANQLTLAIYPDRFSCFFQLPQLSQYLAVNDCTKSNSRSPFILEI